MKVRIFNYEKDYAQLKEWYFGWGYEPIPPELLPKYGLIVSNQGHDVCAAFLYLTDGKVGLFEGAIMDPSAPKERRRGTLLFLHKAMQALARELGCLQAWVISKDKTLTKMSKDEGFWCFPKDFNVLTKRLQ